MIVHEKKAAFVGNELTALICKINTDIHSAAYTTDPSGEEFVWIYDTEGQLLKQVCVTADSLLALTEDVLKSI